MADNESGKGEGKEFSKELRSRIQQSIDTANEEHRREMFRKRLDLARKGLVQYEKRKIGESVKSFMAYLKILEDWKEVGSGDLTPSMFDQKHEQAELLLISGIYWDLVKIYDRSDKPDTIREFRSYMRKYLQFSKGQPYQHVCAETLRKFISTGKPKHTPDFKAAYKELKPKGDCFIATSVHEYLDPREIETLRKFRDKNLRKTSVGRSLVGAYYKIGPSIARRLDDAPDSKRKAVAKVVQFAAQVISRASRNGLL